MRSSLGSSFWPDLGLVPRRYPTGLRWIGLIAGFYVGIAIAPSLSTKITHSSWRPILALVIAVVAAYVGNSLGPYSVRPSERP